MNVVAKISCYLERSVEIAQRIFKYTVSQKTLQNCFCQNFVIFPPNLILFGRRMRGKEAKIVRGVLMFHLIKFASPHYRVKRRCSKLLTQR